MRKPPVACAEVGLSCARRGITGAVREHQPRRGQSVEHWIKRSFKSRTEYLSVFGLTPGAINAQSKALRIANAAASVRFAEPVLARMLRTWLATVLGLTKSSAAICRLPLPVAPSRNTCATRALRPAGRRGGAVALRRAGV